MQRTCFEYLRQHVATTSDLLEEAATGAAFALWSEIEPDLAELHDYGGGDYETQDHVGSLLYDLATKLQNDSVPRADRRALLDKVLPYIRSGNAGMDDALYDVAYAACRDDEDWRDLAERFEALGPDWPIDHARRIYRRLGDREKYLALRGRRMKYGADYHDLATFHWEQGERQRALEVARTGMQKAEGRMDELRAFLAERAKEAGDTQAYLELQFAQATEPLTLVSYKAFRKLCTAPQWAVFEPRILYAMRDADDEEQIKIHMHRGEHDRAVRVLSAMDYSDRRFAGDQILRVARQLEREYPEQILAFYLSGLPKHSWNATREVYARWAGVVGKARHMWVDVLKTPAEWDNFAKKLKSANAKRRAFQEEVANVVPGWNQLLAHSSSTSPVAIRGDPLVSARGRRRQAEVQDGNRLTFSAAPTDRDDLVRFVDVHPLDDHGHPEDFGLEREGELLLNHREEPHGLLVVVVCIDRRLFDQQIQLCFAEL